MSKHSHKITVETDLINAVQALTMLRYFDPSKDSKPNTRLLLPHVQRGELTRIKIKGNAYWYKKEEISQLFFKIAN